LLRTLPELAFEQRGTSVQTNIELEVMRTPIVESDAHAPVPTVEPARARRMRATPSARPALAESAQPPAAAQRAPQTAQRPVTGKALPAREALSPRAAALSAWAARPGSPAAHGASAETEQGQAALAQRRSAELSAELSASARGGTPQPRKLALKHDPDGTCHFAGHAVNATILPDGGVRFEELAARLEPSLGPEEPPELPVTPEDMVAPQQLSLSFELRARAWETERRWFLRETEALRAELADTARNQELARLRAHLQIELEQIWCDGAQSPAARRRALFERWDDTSPDEVGQLARDTVVEFVRLNLPQPSELAYAPAELAALNAGREQRAPYEPYQEGAPRDAGAD
jgi:hypothetical protein